MKSNLNQQVLGFSSYADKLNVRCVPHESNSLVGPGKLFQVIFISPLPMPKDLCSQDFEEQSLLAIEQALGCNPIKAAKCLAIRNAWIAYVQNGEIPAAVSEDCKIQIPAEVVSDYILLTSKIWFKHPWILSALNRFENDFVTIEEASDCSRWDQWYQGEEGSIWWCINESLVDRRRNKQYSSILERNAEYAKADINRANEAIKDLRSLILEQEGIITTAKRAIRKYQNAERENKRASPGKPKLSDQDAIRRKDWACKFVSQWVVSLKAVLSLESTGEIARVLGGNKMTWWRWQNKKELASIESLKSLLDVKVKSGVYQGIKLKEIQTSPSMDDLIKLVSLV